MAAKWIQVHFFHEGLTLHFIQFRGLTEIISKTANTTLYLRRSFTYNNIVQPSHTQSLKHSLILNDPRENDTFIYDLRSSTDKLGRWDRSWAYAARRSPTRRRSVFRKTQERRLWSRAVNQGVSDSLASATANDTRNRFLERDKNCSKK